MYTIIVLDTNIYRQLGASFYQHVDYKGLLDYHLSSGGEIAVLNTVLMEYLDFYKKEIIDKNIADIKRATEKLQKLEKFKKIKAENLSHEAEIQLVLIKKHIKEHHVFVKESGLLNEEDLLEFLMENKLENRKDNTRDYLIWLNCISLAAAHPDNRVILISDDKIFSENDHFKLLQTKHGAHNIAIFKSLPAFLSVYGFTSPQLTAKLILRDVPRHLLEQELLEAKDAIPSYISYFYYHEERKFGLEEFNMNRIRVENFYAHKNVETETVEVIAHLLVSVYFRFEPEPNIDALKKYLSTEKGIHRDYAETFDQDGRPIYQEEVLCLLSMTYNEDLSELIETSISLFDFDDYVMKKYQSLN